MKYYYNKVYLSQHNEYKWNLGLYIFSFSYIISLKESVSTDNYLATTWKKVKNSVRVTASCYLNSRLIYIFIAGV